MSTESGGIRYPLYIWSTPFLTPPPFAHTLVKPLHILIFKLVKKAVPTLATFL